MTVTPKTPDDAWFRTFFTDSLLKTPNYFIDEPDVDVRLDRNESPYDWPEASKKRVAEAVCRHPWNRYLHAYDEELISLFSAYTQVPTDCIMIGPGSNYLLGICLTLFGSALKGKMYVAQPSFPLYESHCGYMNIPFVPWKLTSDFRYDVEQLRNMPKGSVVVFASPNNPTGDVFPVAEFRQLLQDHPDCYFLADEAYYEFANETYTELLEEFSNLLITRTFSKALSGAALRMGYILASPRLIKQIEKLIAPYIITPFVHEAIKEALTNAETRSSLERSRAIVLQERDRMFRFFSTETPSLRVWPSQANFLLVQWHVPERALAYYKKLVAHGFLVRNVTKAPGLGGCLRITMGSPEQNTQIQDIFRNLEKGEW